LSSRWNAQRNEWCGLRLYGLPSDSEFELYAVDRDGSKLERITLTGGFNAFPQFSPNGKRLVFASNRNAKPPHEINIFLADWVE
jgi:Tol biopolymer transport system component